MSRTAWLAACAALASSACADDRRPAPNRPAPPAIPVEVVQVAADEHPHPFTVIAGIAELHDGRVVASDPRERRVRIVDFEAGRDTELRRTGAGPGEYRLPSRILLTTNGVGLIDRDLSRMTRFDSNMALVSTTAMTFRGQTFMLGADTDPVGLDESGDFLYVTSGITRGGTGPRNTGRPVVIRVRADGNRIDTVTTLYKPVSAAIRDNAVVRTSMGGAYDRSDRVVVTARGELAVIRVADYHVEYISRRGRRAGAPIPHDSVEIPERRRTASGSSPPPKPAVATGGLPDAPPRIVPQYLSPVIEALPAADGSIWLLRSRGDSVSRWDVVVDGKVSRRIEMPVRTLVGVGRNNAYAVRVDDDGLRYLRRYQIRP